MENSLSNNTINQYNTTLKLWWDFCRSKKISPFVCDTTHIILFFQNLLTTTNNKFGSFNSHRAALSLLTSRNLGEDIHIKRFMKGIFRLRPPRPKYNCTWDPQVVLHFLEKTTDTSLKMLSYKLTTLLTLATGQRLQTIALIKCNNIQFSDSGAKIFIPDLIKTSRPGSMQPFLDLPTLTSKPRLCVASTLRNYITRTQDLRDPSSDQLLLTFNKPYGPASKQTLSRWVKNTLAAAGVDVTLFKPHSTRHSATSAALRNGLSLDTIRTSASWSAKSSTFARVYNRPLHQPDSFLSAVINTTA